MTNLHPRTITGKVLALLAIAGFTSQVLCITNSLAEEFIALETPENRLYRVDGDHLGTPTLIGVIGSGEGPDLCELASAGPHTLYSIDRAGDRLWTLSISAAGVVVDHVTEELIPGLVDPRGLDVSPLDGKVYAILSSDPAQLYTIDPLTGTTRFVSEIIGPSESIEAIAFGPDGTLYVAAWLSQLYVLDVNSGLLSFIGIVQPEGRKVDIDAMTFGSDGFLYTTDSLSGWPADLVRIDPSTAAAETVGNTGVPGLNGLTRISPAARAVELNVIKAYLHFAKDDELAEAESEQTYDYSDGSYCPTKDGDRLRVVGTMDLTEESDGIDPPEERVTFSAGIHSVDIPAGSFHWWPKAEAYGYAGDYDGGWMWLMLKELSFAEGLWEYRARFVGIDNSGMGSPMAVKLSVGDDSGESEVNLFGNLRYEAP